MLRLDYSKITELSGDLTVLHSKESVNVESLSLFPSDLKKFASVLSNNDVNKNNQSFSGISIVITEDDSEIFERGQSILQNGLFSSASNAQRFIAKFDATVPVAVSPDIIYSCKITLGNIEFDLSHSSRKIRGDGTISYENVEMIFYPGKYNVIVNDEL